MADREALIARWVLAALGIALLVPGGIVAGYCLLQLVGGAGRRQWALGLVAGLIVAGLGFAMLRSAWRGE